MREKIWEKFNRFYFIGIGGVSMSGLAKFLLSRGKFVAGSDTVRSIYTDELKNQGAAVEFDLNGSVLETCDVVIYTDAISGTDERLRIAKSLNKIIVPRGRFLYEVSTCFDKVIAVSGCHGKTTCTSMLAHIFAAANRGFGLHVGGRDKTFGNSYFCGNTYFITEACEYKRNFLSLEPDVAVVLNTDPDHLECYGSEENLIAAYREFTGKAETSVCLFGGIKGSVTFGYDENADYSAKNISEESEPQFEIYEHGKRLGEVKLNVLGEFNVLNALAATAAARCFGVPFKNITEGLASFKGVERRFEDIGLINGARCIADYAHHPNEIAAALRTVSKIPHSETYVIFQPHTYSRTKNLFNEFVEVLSGIGNLLVYRTFAAREYFDDKGSALTLSQALKNSKYGDCPQDMSDFLQNLKKDDIALFLGAGDVYEIAKTILRQN